MAAVKTNVLLPGIAMLFIGAVGFVVYKITAQPKPFIAEAKASTAKPSIFTADADGTAETIRALQAAVEAQNAEQQKLIQQNQDLMEQNQRALAQIAAGDAKAKAAIDEALRESEARQGNEQSVLSKQLQTLQNAVRDMTNARANDTRQAVAPEPATTEIVPGFGLGSEQGVYDPSIDAYWVGGGGGTTVEGVQPSTGSGGFVPLAMQGVQSASNARGALFDRSSSGSASPESSTTARRPTVAPAASQPAPPKAEPFFTLPDLSALTGGVSATSLIGRVYDTDKVTDPYPFKVSIGRENFAASFIDLPDEIEGMLFEGYAIGDWTLSCVRGDLVAASFIFADGTIVKAYGPDKGSRPKEAQIKKDTIGFISDEYGNPCIEGTKHTSAPPALMARFLATGLQGYGEAVADAETERYRDATGATTTAVTGDIGRFAGGQALESGAADAADWIRRRSGRLIDVIYAESGQGLTVHLQQEIYIDKQPNARKVRYAKQGKRHANLD